MSVDMPILVTRDFPPARGGVQRFVEGLALAFHENGEPVYVVAPEQEGDHEFDRNLPYAVKRLPRGGRIGFAWRTYFAVADARRTIRDHRLIASLWQPSGYEALLANAGNSARVTLIAHGSEITKQQHGLRRILASAILRRCNVVAVSRFTKAAVEDLGAHAEVIPPGVAIVDYQRARAAEPTILSVGRLVRRKGFDRVIDALPELQSRVPGVHLQIVGDGPDRAYLQELAHSNGVSDAVSFHTDISDADLHDLYSRAWCFAMPNRTEDGYDAEGLGIVFLEAGLHRVPAIGGLFSGAEDAIIDGETGLLVDGRVQREITEALNLLLTDSIYAERLGSAARLRVVADFGWREIARRFARLGISSTPQLASR